VENTLQT